MFPNYQSLKRQNGSMLLVALFVIIVLGALTISMMQAGSDNTRTTVFEVLGMRALNAANSGVEQALGEVIGVGGSGQCSNVSANMDLSSIAGLKGCTVILSCSEVNIAATGFIHYTVTGDATCAAGEFVAERSVSVEARERQ